MPKLLMAINSLRRGKTKPPNKSEENRWLSNLLWRGKKLKSLRNVLIGAQVVSALTGDSNEIPINEEITDLKNQFQSFQST